MGAIPMTILDGGMGQELVRRSGTTPTGLWATEIMINHPEYVRDVHDAFFAAGAQVATVNSYAIHRDRLGPAGIEDQFEGLHRRACEIACESRDAFGAGIVAGSLGPLGWSYSHDGAPPAERAAELYREICVLQADLVDVFLIETIASIEQAGAALAGAKGHGRPVWLALTVADDDGTRLRSGESIGEALAAMASDPPEVLLLNCSVPEAITKGLPLLSGAGIPFGAYANGFTGISSSFLSALSSVDKLSARTDLTPDAYADHVAAWVDLGATVVGGCCEVGPLHIAELTRRFGVRNEAG